MELDIEINNLSKSPVKKYFLKNIFRKVFQRVELEFFEKKKVSLSVALVSSGEIRKLNKIYRKKNLTTDVLSFCEFESKKKIMDFSEKEIFLGEIVLCYNEIVRYSKKEKKKEKEEFAKIAAHGLLHLLGFNHGEKMFQIQESILK